MGACLRCGEMRHYIRDCPQPMDRPTNSAGSVKYPVPSQPAPSGIPRQRALSTPVTTDQRPRSVSSQRGRPAPRPAGRVYSTAVEDLQSRDLIEGETSARPRSEPSRKGKSPVRPDETD
ncbi:unnamed protein product [Victoria cruziana]